MPLLNYFELLSRKSAQQQYAIIEVKEENRLKDVGEKCMFVGVAACHCRVVSKQQIITVDLCKDTDFYYFGGKYETAKKKENSNKL